VITSSQALLRLQSNMIIDVFELTQVLPNLEMWPQKHPYKQFSPVLGDFVTCH